MGEQDAKMFVDFIIGLKNCKFSVNMVISQLSQTKSSVKFSNFVKKNLSLVNIKKCLTNGA